MTSAEVVVGVTVSAPEVVLSVTVATMVSCWLIVGSGTFPLTCQPPFSYVGQAGAVSVGVYSELGEPVGVSVFQTACKLEKSG